MTMIPTIWAIVIGLFALTGLLANISIVLLLFFIIKKGGNLILRYIEEEDEE